MDIRGRMILALDPGQLSAEGDTTAGSSSVPKCEVLDTVSEAMWSEIKHI